MSSRSKHTQSTLFLVTQYGISCNMTRDQGSITEISREIQQFSQFHLITANVEDCDNSARSSTSSTESHTRLVYTTLNNLCCHHLIRRIDKYFSQSQLIAAFTFGILIYSIFTCKLRHGCTTQNRRINAMFSVNRDWICCRVFWFCTNSECWSLKNAQLESSLEIKKIWIE